jgi:hypothetical protein
MTTLLANIAEQLTPLGLVLVTAAIVIISVALGYLVFWWTSHRKGESASKRAAEVISDAKQRAENVQKEAELHAKDEIFKQREKFEQESQ